MRLVFVGRHIAMRGIFCPFIFLYADPLLLHSNVISTSAQGRLFASFGKNVRIFIVQRQGNKFLSKKRILKHEKGQPFRLPSAGQK